MLPKREVKVRKRSSTKDLKVRYKPICHSAPEIGKLVELLGARLAGREEPGFKKLKIKSQEGEKEPLDTRAGTARAETRQDHERR